MSAVAYKAFTRGLTCRDFQYKIGATYKHEGKVVRCASGGFHSCELSLDVLSYYPPIGSRFAEVEVAGEIDRANDDTKIASAEITIKAEIRMPDLIAAAVRWVMGRVAATTGDGAVAASLGPCGQAKAGEGGAIVCCEYDSDLKLIGIKAAMVGACGIEKDTWYRLEGGEFVACENGGAA